MKRPLALAIYLGAFASICFCGHALASTEYYCPAIDGYFLENDYIVEGQFSGPPASINDKVIESKALKIQGSYCGNEEYNCISLNNEGVFTYNLVIPKRIYPNMTFHYKNISGIVLSPLKLSGYGSEVLIKIHNEGDPDGDIISLVVKNGVGITSINGINLLDSHSANRYSCLLSSKVGMFPKTYLRDFPVKGAIAK